MRGFLFVSYIAFMEERAEELRELINQYMSYIFIAEGLLSEAEDELRSINEAINYQKSLQDY